MVTMTSADFYDMLKKLSSSIKIQLIMKTPLLVVLCEHNDICLFARRLPSYM